jgi:hypothetical protein
MFILSIFKVPFIDSKDKNLKQTYIHTLFILFSFYGFLTIVEQK